MKKPELTPAEIKKLRDAGWTYKKISQEYDVSEGTIKARAQRAGLTRSRPMYDLPWEIEPEHRRSSATKAAPYQYQMLVVHAALLRGEPVSDERRKRYENWRQKLREEHAVVEYIAKGPDAGFHYVDGDPDAGKWPVFAVNYDEILRHADSTNGRPWADDDARRYG